MYVHVCDTAVCVLHMTPFFLPVDIQHSQCVRADSSILLVEEIQVLWSQSCVRFHRDTTTIRCHAYHRIARFDDTNQKTHNKRRQCQYPPAWYIFYLARFWVGACSQHVPDLSGVPRFTVHPVSSSLLLTSNNYTYLVLRVLVTGTRLVHTAIVLCITILMYVCDAHHVGATDRLSTQPSVCLTSVSPFIWYIQQQYSSIQLQLSLTTV